MKSRTRVGLGVAGGFVAGLAAGAVLALSLPGFVPVAAPSPSPPDASSSPEPTASPDRERFPTGETTGVPAGWTPSVRLTGEHTIWDDGAVVQDLRLTDGVLYIRASNVTLRRVELVGARVVNDYGRDCFNGLRIEDSSFVRGEVDLGLPVIQSGGYTLSRVKIDGHSEGVRAGERELGCEPVVIEDSWMHLDPPDGCSEGGVDWHGDGVQGYLGPEVVIRNTSITLAQTPQCQGTAAFFYPDQGNERVVVDGLLLAGGGFVFRLGTPGSVSGLKVVDGSWEFGPVDVLDCGAVEWGAGNEVVTVDADGGTVPVGPLDCASG